MIYQKFEDDRHVIELAIFLNATLVTLDERLVNELPEWIEEKRLNISIQSPAEVLQEEDLL